MVICKSENEMKGSEMDFLILRSSYRCIISKYDCKTIYMYALFFRMKIVHVHWPKVSNNGGLFLANNGALRLKGKYLIQRPGV